MTDQEVREERETDHLSDREEDFHSQRDWESMKDLYPDRDEY